MPDDEFTTPVYYERDANRAYLDDKVIAVIGFGSQGHAHALNLHDSGHEVIVGLREESASREEATDAGLAVATPSEAARQGDIVSVLVPDHVIPSVYEEIEPELSESDTLLFAHAFSVHYNQVTPPSDVDVSMVAPKSPGGLVRRNFKDDQGTPALLAVYQDVTNEANAEALAYAQGIGCARAGVVETTFQEEVESDLFGEQAILCGGVTSLIKMSFETLVDNGYSPEMAYFECLNELKLIVDLMYEGGLTKMWDDVSDTAEYGGLTRGPSIVDDQVRSNMEDALEDVQNGTFAREWINENQANRPSYERLRQQDQNHQIEEVGDRLRDLFAWSEE